MQRGRLHGVLLSVRLFGVLIEALNSHLSQPLLNHFMHQAIVPNKAAFVLGRVVAVRALVQVALLSSLTQSLPEMAISKMS